MINPELIFFPWHDARADYFLVPLLEVSHLLIHIGVAAAVPVKVATNSSKKNISLRQHALTLDVRDKGLQDLGLVIFRPWALPRLGGRQGIDHRLLQLGSGLLPLARRSGLRRHLLRL